jgi:hypothetical protein
MHFHHHRNNPQRYIVAMATMLLLCCNSKQSGWRSTQVAEQVWLAPAAYFASRMTWASDGTIIATSNDRTSWILPSDETPKHSVAGWAITSRGWPAPYLSWTTIKPTINSDTVAPEGYRILDPSRPQLAPVVVSLPPLPPPIVDPHAHDDIWFRYPPRQEQPQWVVIEALSSADAKFAYLVFYARPGNCTWIVKLDTTTWAPLASTMLAETPYLRNEKSSPDICEHSASIALATDGATLYIATASNVSVTALATADLSTRWRRQLATKSESSNYEQLQMVVGSAKELVIVSGHKYPLTLQATTLTVLASDGNIVHKHDDISGIVNGIEATDVAQISVYGSFARDQQFSLYEHQPPSMHRPYFDIARVGYSAGTKRSVFREPESPNFGGGAMIWDRGRQRYWVGPKDIENLHRAQMVSPAWYQARVAEDREFTAALEARIKPSKRPAGDDLFFSESEVWAKVKSQPTQLANLSEYDRRRLLDAFTDPPVDADAIMTVLRTAPAEQMQDFFLIYKWELIDNALTGAAKLQFEKEFPKPPPVDP